MAAIANRPARRKAQTYSKIDALKAWARLEPNQDPFPHMGAIPYKATGSTYGACGVRIDGTPEFVDAVLSCLQSLLQGESTGTRLGLSRRAVESVEIAGKRKDFGNREYQSEVCYIRLHKRGLEGEILQTILESIAESD